MMGLGVGRLKFGNPNVPAWKPPKRRPAAVSNHDQTATPKYEDIGLKHFIVPGLPTIKSHRSDFLVCYWMPTASSISRIATIAERVYEGEGLPLVVDVGTCNGFLPFLLAQTNRVSVVGIDPNGGVIARSQFKHPNLELVRGDAAWAVQKYEGYASLVTQSWPPPQANLTGHIRRIAANAIVNIFDQLFYGAKTNRLKSIRGYTGFGFWRGPTVMDFNLAILEKDTPAMGNAINIQLRNGIRISGIFPRVEEQYPWEVEAHQRFGNGFRDSLSRAERMRIV